MDLFNIGDQSRDNIINKTNTLLKEENIRDSIKTYYKEYSLPSKFEIPPTLIAKPLYEQIGKMLNCNDPYMNTKLESIEKAREIKLDLLSRIDCYCDDISLLRYGICCAVLGNVIDYGAQIKFDLDKEKDSIFSIPFKYFCIEDFMYKLKTSDKILYIGDNAGENELDEILIRIIKKINNNIEIFYFVRGQNIINDITMNDLIDSDSELFNLCNVVSSGVGTPGFIYYLANQEALEIYNNVDLVLAKGMGNFESMESMRDSRVFFLLKVKCNVVARYLKADIGDFAFLDCKEINKL